MTPGDADDAPWCLVAPPARPALLQPAIPSGVLAELKNFIATPDALDMLVTAKNHDLKQAVMAAAQPAARADSRLPARHEHEPHGRRNPWLRA